ncbi:AlpA family transcriptional regulator [Bradyrhizobium sp. th.b2]|uniref:helix-turn-helix transcriptional regulator n=1 Tax=Bradyrhizobium sp. th-b2 TaxID=172088 RepID=UPI0003FE19C3|nr:AlpA family phage regulatory protein [Bradyrhizobium sp. th.b2]
MMSKLTAAKEKLLQSSTSITDPDDEHTTTRPRKMLSEKDVLNLVPFSRTTLFRLEKNGKFPRSTFVSPNRRCWFEAEITAWQTAFATKDYRDPERPRRGGRPAIKKDTTRTPAPKAGVSLLGVK